MKNYFYRYLPKERDAKIVQYMIPYPMPRHMDATATAKPVANVVFPSNVAVITREGDLLRENEEGK